MTREVLVEGQRMGWYGERGLGEEMKKGLDWEK